LIIIVISLSISLLHMMLLRLFCYRSMFVSASHKENRLLTVYKFPKAQDRSSWQVTRHMHCTNRLTCF
jgi:hypothetical protein